MSDESYTTLQTYPQPPNDEDDYYALLGLPRNPPPSDPEIRSAYRTLTFSFHPDKQPSHLREAAQRHFERIHEAYETLIDARKRTVYDILGAEGVRAEWSATGTMGGGVGAKKEVGVKAKSPEEFRRWFLELMRKRERVAVNSMVQSRGAVTLGIDASDMVELSEDGTEFFVHVPEVKTGSFAVGYNFKAPFPTWEGVLGEMVKEDDDDEEEKEEGNEKNAYDEALFKPELTINAGISGPVEHLVQEAKLRYEDGREGSAEVGHTPRPVEIGLVLKTNGNADSSTTNNVYAGGDPWGYGQSRVWRYDQHQRHPGQMALYISQQLRHLRECPYPAIPVCDYVDYQGRRADSWGISIQNHVF